MFYYYSVCLAGLHLCHNPPKKYTHCWMYLLYTVPAVWCTHGPLFSAPPVKCIIYPRYYQPVKYFIYVLSHILSLYFSCLKSWSLPAQVFLSIEQPAAVSVFPLFLPKHFQSFMQIYPPYLWHFATLVPACPSVPVHGTARCRVCFCQLIISPMYPP